MKHLSFFILGTQRSGTTLMARILGAKSDLYIKNEIDLLRLFPNSTTPADEIISNLGTLMQEKLGPDPDAWLDENGYSLFALKDPQLCLHLDKLEPLTKQYKFIITVRDPRGVINSYLQNDWGLAVNAYAGAKRWNEEVGYQVAFAKRHPQSVMLVKYEDLLSDLRGTLQNICDFLGFELTDEIVNYHQKSATYAISDKNIHTNRPPDEKLSKRWSSSLTNRQIAIIESAASELMAFFNYTPAEKPVRLSGLQTGFYQLHQAVVGELKNQWMWRGRKVKKKLKSLF